MHQIVQNLKTGATELLDTHPPAPPGASSLLPVAALISAGTERMLVEFGHANLL